MKIDNFILENWLNPACDSEKNKVYMGGSCVDPMTLDELLELAEVDKEQFYKDLSKLNLGYGRFEGFPMAREGLARLYKNVKPEDVILVHGGTGANNTVVMTLLEPIDNIISVMPNYQQFYSIPKSMGVEVRVVDLIPEKGYRLQLDNVRKLVDKKTKAIMMTNPNNPTGSLMTLEEMKELVEIAKENDSWIVCDEMYRGLGDEYMWSFADLYDKAIVTASSSKIYSMAGLRVGWIICKAQEMRKELFNRRSFDSIVGGVFDEWVFGLGLNKADRIFERSRNIVKKNKAIVDEWLKDHKYLKQYAEGFGTTYLIHYNLDIPSVEFCDGLLDKKGALVCHGDCFFIPHSFRLCLSHSGVLEEGTRLIDEYIQELLDSGVKLLNE